MIGVNGDSQPMWYLNADMTRSRYTAHRLHRVFA